MQSVETTRSILECGPVGRMMAELQERRERVSTGEWNFMLVLKDLPLEMFQRTHVIVRNHRTHMQFPTQTTRSETSKIMVCRVRLRAFNQGFFFFLAWQMTDGQMYMK